MKVKLPKIVKAGAQVRKLVKAGYTFTEIASRIPSKVAKKVRWTKKKKAEKKGKIMKTPIKELMNTLLDLRGQMLSRGGHIDKIVVSKGGFAAIKNINNYLDIPFPIFPNETNTGDTVEMFGIKFECSSGEPKNE